MDAHRAPAMTAVGFVIIGRNEGARLDLAIASVTRTGHEAVYVDSGSSDGSVALARARGLAVVELDPARPFTAARARNAGLQWHRRRDPRLELLHFIDGDCELVPGWLDKACAALLADERLAAVCGRRRERAPDASRYNRLCEDEWNTPVGLADTVGGDALFRVAALAQVQGFDEMLIAGEEPELCHRIRRRGWLIRRIEGDMTIHDAAMTRFAQWWQRNRRNGYATAEALAMRGTEDHHARRRLRREVASNVLWSLPPSWPFWPLLWLRVRLRRDALQATWMTLGKLPHLQGQLDYWQRRERRGGTGRRIQLIEYK
ncbi:glycosyltransferase family A protein [Novosphingobium resinovorum]|uniref:glycosyltransferase family 2 protein n=1 Tax=Novosphingobium resinovorum TaxID=158500 RepID=UPI002ED03478|nr:glycosyltransferase family A protein [Novosphingobium resinovorum]